MTRRWIDQALSRGLPDDGQREPAPPARPPAGQDPLEQSMAAHPAGGTGNRSLSEPLRLVVDEQLQTCASCADMAARLCDACGAVVLAACGQERRRSGR